MKLTFNQRKQAKHNGAGHKLREQIEHLLEQTDLDERVIERAGALRERVTKAVPPETVRKLRERAEHVMEDIAARAPHVELPQVQSEKLQALGQQVRERAEEVIETVQTSLPGSTPKRTIWDFAHDLPRWLIGWNVLNIAFGIALSKGESPVRRGIATQNVGWGVINIFIGLFAMFSTRRRKAKIKRPNAPDVLKKETNGMRNLLLVNLFLDLVYMFGGSRTADSLNVYQRGIGLGIIIQGGLLFVWDTFLLLAMPSKKSQGIRK
jgi:hypothetical protein